MKQNLLLQILVCLLVIFSAFYIRYRKQTDVVEAMSGYPEYISRHSSNMTFSDFMNRVTGEKCAWEN